MSPRLVEWFLSYPHRSPGLSAAHNFRSHRDRPATYPRPHPSAYVGIGQLGLYLPRGERFYHRKKRRTRETANTRRIRFRQFRCVVLETFQLALSALEVTMCIGYHLTPANPPGADHKVTCQLSPPGP